MKDIIKETEEQRIILNSLTKLQKQAITKEIKGIKKYICNHKQENEIQAYRRAIFERLGLEEK